MFNKNNIVENLSIHFPLSQGSLKHISQPLYQIETQFQNVWELTSLAIVHTEFHLRKYLYFYQHNIIITVIIAHPCVCLVPNVIRIPNAIPVSVKSSSSAPAVIIRIIIIKHPLIRSLTCFLFKTDPLNARVVAALPGRSRTWSEMGRYRTRY